MNRENCRDKDLKNTYLWVDREEKYGEKYEEILLYKQSVPGLISFYEAGEDEEKGLVYILNHQKSFLEALGAGRMTCAHMESLIRSLAQVMETVDEYLLEPSNLVVEMAYIFGSAESWKYVYVPGYREDFWRQMEKLSEEWLNYVDYSDERAVLWAYTFYQKVHGEGCFPLELMEIIDLEKPALTTVSESVIREEAAVWEAKKEIPAKKQGWRAYISKKLKKFVLGKGTMEEDIFGGFYDSDTNFGDTCPDLSDVSESVQEALNNQRSFILIPVGDNDASVIRVEHFPFLIGRAPEEVDFLLDNAKISRIHARLEGGGQEVRIVDMHSINGTGRNGEGLKPGTEYILYSGDILKLADMEFACQWC